MMFQRMFPPDWSHSPANHKGGISVKTLQVLSGPDLNTDRQSEYGLHPPLCIRIQIPHHGERLVAARRCLDAPSENLKLMPLWRPSAPCFKERAIDPNYHLLGWFGDNTRMIDFLVDLFFNAFADSERSVACRG
jgi:hypothetical protein